MAKRSSKLEKLDVVYPVRPTSDNNLELMYSLRSLKNLPHRDVHIFSDYISWLDQHAVKWHPSSDRPDKRRFANVNTTLMRACDDPNISDPFIFMNDDFFIMKPIKDIPYYYNGTLQQHYDYLHQYYQRPSKYMRDLLETQSELKRLKKPTLDYEMHCPMIFYKDELRKVLKAYPNTACRRTFYANFKGVKGEQAIDFKIYGFGEFDQSRPFVSTTDTNFKRQSVVRSLIRSEFTQPSPYEK